MSIQMQGLVILAGLLFAAGLFAILVAYSVGSPELKNSSEWIKQYKRRGRIMDIELNYIFMWLLIRAEILLGLFVLAFLFTGMLW